MYTIKDFETANPGYTFDNFKMNKDRTVIKVSGRVKVNKKTKNCGSYTYCSSDKKVRWDGEGRCYSCNSNTRLREYDIPLKHM